MSIRTLPLLAVLSLAILLPACDDDGEKEPPGETPVVAKQDAAREATESAKKETPAAAAEAPKRRRGQAVAEVARPPHFPHRIWAACDFEARLPKYGWFGRTESANIPAYPGNVTALRANAGAYKNFAAQMTGINPVPGPCMGKVNYMYCRYYLKGGDSARFQHYSLTRGDNNNILVTGLKEGAWAEVTLNFTRDARRNDGSEEAFAEGERMDDLKVFAGKPGDGKTWDLALDDIIFFSTDPALPPEAEPFPNRVLYVAGFDTGNQPKKPEEDQAGGKYLFFPGELEITGQGLPSGHYWGAAVGVPAKEGKGAGLRLAVEPAKPVGEHTKLRVRYHLSGAKELKVRLHDQTAGGLREVVLGAKPGAWTFAYADFTKDGKCLNGEQTPLAAGNIVEGISFLAEPDGEAEVKLYVDEVVLFDAGKPAPEGAKLP